MCNAKKLLAVPQVSTDELWAYQFANERSVALQTINMSAKIETYELFATVNTDPNKYDIFFSPVTNGTSIFFGFAINIYGGDLYMYYNNVYYSTGIQRTYFGGLETHFVVRRVDTSLQIKANSVNLFTTTIASTVAVNEPLRVGWGNGGTTGNYKAHSIRISSDDRYGSGSYTIPDPTTWVADTNTLVLLDPKKALNNVAFNRGTTGQGTIIGVTDYNALYVPR